MAEKNTSGAVHLTSLSLDLTQLQENINTIETEMAALADSAVQYGEKIRNSLNMPTEQMSLSVDTTALTQGIDNAEKSVERFGNTFRTVTKEIQGGQNFNIDNFNEIADALNLTEDEASKASEKLEVFLSSLREYDKVSISASSDGKLMQAVINTTDEAGTKIRQVIDLTKELDDKFLSSSVTITDNAEQRNAAIEKTNNAIANSLNRVISQYEKLAAQVSKSDLDDFVKEDFISKINLSKNEIKGLQNEIRETDKIVNASNLSPRFEQFSKTLDVITSDFEQATKSQKEFLSDSDKQISKISNQYERLSNNVEKSSLYNLVKESFIQRIREAQTSIQNLSQDVKEVSSIAQKGDYDKQFSNLSFNLKEITSDFEQATRQQKEFSSGEKLVEDLTKDYATLQNRLAGIIYSMTTSKINTPEIVTAIDNAKSLAVEMANVSEAVRNSDYVTEGAKSTFDNFADAVNRISLYLKNAKTGNAEYRNSLLPIENQAKSTIASLKTLEKTAIFKTSKDKVAALRAEYQQFLEKLKNTNVGTDEAERELGELQKKFLQLDNTVKKGNGTLENWVNKITESAKWQIANSALNLLQQSFGQLTTTIIDTENAVIELRRVLNDDSLVDSEMSSELYNIAYEFGQTFEAVQEVAIKFAQTGLTWQETVDATRATMLGLNTAELEVSTATEGLIAVMAQFGIEATELESVIDKINITADNFPVTSEKIVAALQRAGGTANAFGLSLEETIGIITALGEATGRAGESIGTAMNSLISFSMKDSALEKFSEFLGKDVSNYGVLELWKELSVAIKSGDESIAAMMSTSEEFSDLLNEELATSVGLEEEFTKANEETNRAIAEGRDIYSTVGTYRQNYFIALLNNIATAIEAIQNMNGAIGYSMQENEIAMESFSKKWNQLVASAQELAVQFGEAGFLDLMKGAVDATSSVLQLVKALGGITPLLVAISGGIIAIKKEKIKDKLAGLTVVIQAVTGATKIYEMALIDGATKMQAFGVAASSVFAGLGGWVTLAGVAITAIGAISAAQKRAAEESRKAREETIAQVDDSVKAFETVGLAYKEYRDAQSSANDAEYKKARDELLVSLGYEADDINALIAIYGSEEEAIRSLTQAKYEQMQLNAQAAYNAITSEEKIKEVAQNRIEVAQSDREYLERLIAQGKNYGNVLDELDRKLEQSQLGMDLGSTNIELVPDVDLTNVKSVKAEIERLDSQLEDYNGVITESEKKTSILYQTTKKVRDAYVLYSVEVERLKVLLDDSKLSYDEYVERLSQARTELEESIVTGSEWGSNLEELKKKIEELNGEVDTFQSSYKTLNEIVKSYNETGSLTADQLQTLLGLEPEYIQLLDNKNGSLSINQERLQDLIATQDQYMNDLTALTIAQNIDTMVTEAAAAAKAGLTIEEYKAQLATRNLQSTTYILVKQLLDGEISTDKFKEGISGIATQAGVTSGYLGDLTGSIVNMTNAISGFYTIANQTRYTLQEAQMWGYQDPSDPDFLAFMARRNNTKTNTYNQLTNNIGRYYTATTPKSTSSGGSGNSSSNADPYKAEKDALNELLEIYEHSIFLLEKNGGKAEDIASIYKKMQEEVHNQAEKYRAAGVSENDELIRNLQQKWWEFQDNIEEIYKGIYEDTVNTYENAISYLEDLYDSAEQRLDYSYMGENLQKQLDYQVKIQKEAERELERLAKKGMEVNDDAAQDVIDTWYEAEKAIREVSEMIANNILEPYDDFIDLADKFDIWEYMDFTKVDYLRDKLASINDLLYQGTISLKQYNELLKETSYAIYEAQKDIYEKEKDDISNKSKEVVNAYKTDTDALKKQKEEVETYYDSVIDGYNKEIDVWNKRKEEVEEYYDSLIENLNEVQEANERINAQVDYYNERQKIITNLEQAQARSGVEWREKEMEYQQQLIDLDEDWNRTQKDWDIEDQIAAIEELKEIALNDIELSIQAINDTIAAAEQAKASAIEGIEAEIAGIEELISATEQKAEEEIAAVDNKIKEMSEFIANAIKNGTYDGLVDSKQEMDKALVDGTNAMLSFIDQNNTSMVEGADETANTVYGIYSTSFLNPMYNGIDEIASHMYTSISGTASESARDALNAFQTSLVTPLKNEMANIMKQAQTANTTMNTAAASIPTTTAKKLTQYQVSSYNAGQGTVAATPKISEGYSPFYTSSFSNGRPTNIVNITNNVQSTERAARRSKSLLDEFLDPLL